MKYIAILRGINVGGKRKILMADLKLLFSSLGFSQVVSYIQSGNIVFHSEGNKNLSKIIEAEILKQYGFEVPLIVIDKNEFNNIIQGNPYKNKEEKQLYVSFFKASPNLELVNLLSNQSFAPDQFKITEKAVYIFCNTKYSDSKLTNTFLEKKLKETITTRNWKSSLKISELLNE